MVGMKMAHSINNEIHNEIFLIEWCVPQIGQIGQIGQVETKKTNAIDRFMVICAQVDELSADGYLLVDG